VRKIIGLFSVAAMAFVFFPVFAAAASAEEWGFYGHKKINEIAIYTLPAEMLLFFKKNHEFIVSQAVGPDVRRSFVMGEDSKHYIDLDRYTAWGNPLDILPQKWVDAIQKFPKDSLEAHGIAPWSLEATYKKLMYAFKNKNINAILRHAADLGHYCADIHVPLHTTQNYNGQLTGQRGIHGLWESRLPEVFGEEYDYFVDSIQYIPNVLKFAWKIVAHTHEKVDSVLNIEKKLTLSISDDVKYSYEKRGNLTVRVYSRAFCEKYQSALQGMVERQMRRSITALGSLWYSAWVDAGQPDLPALLGGYKQEVEEKNVLNEATVSSVKSREDE
jgi:hypothetical protein